MQEQSNMDSQSSLQLIEAMINKARNQFSENGHLYLLWGWMVLACSLVHFGLMNFTTFRQPYLVWFLTWIIPGYLLRARHKKSLQ